MPVMTVPTTPLTELQIWDRLLKPKEPTLPATAARYFLAFKFSNQDMKRMDELAAKARAGQLTAEEEEEITVYSRMDSFLSILQSKARMSLKKAARSKASTR